MIRGLYTSAAGAIVAEAMIDNVSNNLANVSTNGFKRTLLQIESQPQTDIYRFQTDPGRSPLNRLDGVAPTRSIGQLGSGSDIYATPTNFEQGQIALNGNAYSFALSGPGLLRAAGPGARVRSPTRATVRSCATRTACSRPSTARACSTRRERDRDAGRRQGRSRHQGHRQRRRRYVGRADRSLRVQQCRSAAAARPDGLPRHARSRRAGGDVDLGPSVFAKKRATATSCVRSSTSSTRSVGSTPTKKVISDPRRRHQSGDLHRRPQQLREPRNHHDASTLHRCQRHDRATVQHRHDLQQLGEREHHRVPRQPGTLPGSRSISSCARPARRSALRKSPSVKTSVWA